ncbi:DUF6541 family protein [Actinomyces capricornis]|uniref:Uncharacterized protein n=1 Tax=Actinomyces capricornis TaxID=2755559 RepID=A0ABM7U8H7_9ACTO|nr:DUF6541 family protein [Actinomyces capricornis]BDA63697.1 hypothetical protein MANAM107_05310 [Actinomyces capricornis]
MTNAPALVLAATAALILTPGWLLARAWGARGTTALGAAPALSLAILGPATLLAQRSSQRWAPAILLTGWPMVLLVSGIVTGLVCTWLGRRAAAGRGEGLDRPAMGRRDALEFAGALVLAVVLTAIPVAVGTNGWDSPAQASDGVFHLSATAFVRLTGDASFLGGLAPMYDGMSVYYPTGWHALASLLPGDVVTGANAMVAVLGALVWPLSMAALLREVLRDTGRSLAVGGALAGSVIAPLLMLTSVWPYGLSVVVLPGALALLVRAVRRGSVGAVRRGSAWMLAGLGALGVVMAHGTGVFNLVVLGLPVVIMGGLPAVRRIWVRGGLARAALVLALAGCLAVVVGGAWFMRRSLISVFSFQRGSATIWETLFAVVVDHPLLATFFPWIPGNIVVLVLAVLGAGAWKRVPQVRAWAVGAGASLLLLLLATGPAWPLRLLAGPWYTQRARIMPLLTVAMLVLAAIGIQEATRRWGTRGAGGQDDDDKARRLPAAMRPLLVRARRDVPVAILLASLLLAPAWRWGLREDLLAAIHDPDSVSYGAMLSDGELELIRRAPQVLPEDAVVLGDPSNGSPYLWSVSGVRVIYPSRPGPVSEELTWLGNNANRIETEPRVCEILRRHGAAYYYSDDAPADGVVGGARKPLWGQALAEVPRSALEPIDSQGTAVLWRITACT